MSGDRGFVLRPFRFSPSGRFVYQTRTMGWTEDGQGDMTRVVHFPDSETYVRYVGEVMILEEPYSPEDEVYDEMDALIDASLEKDSIQKDVQPKTIEDEAPEDPEDEADEDVIAAVAAEAARLVGKGPIKDEDIDEFERLSRRAFRRCQWITWSSRDPAEVFTVVLEELEKLVFNGTDESESESDDEMASWWDEFRSLRRARSLDFNNPHHRELVEDLVNIERDFEGQSFWLECYCVEAA